MEAFWNGFEKRASGKSKALWNAAELGAGALGTVGGYRLYKGMKTHKKKKKAEG